MVYNYSKLYPVISNIIYFIILLYAIAIIIKKSSHKDKLSVILMVILAIFSILSLLAGIFSVIYHLNTPSWEVNPETKQKEQFKKSLDLDKGFALILFIYGLLVLLGLIVYTRQFKYIFLNPNFWMGIIFAILSILSYTLATTFDKKSYQCSEGDIGCFKRYQNIYNMYHSAWHLLSGFSAIFWILLINNINI